MKLTAPPPPPPEPPEPEPNPGTSAELGSTTAAEQPGGSVVQTLPDPSTQPQPQAEPQAATWPTWYAKADFTMAVLALGLGFLLASFAARNSDLWVHLAAGKRLVAGQYRPGSDPFSYSAADRAWVNHSWLWDFGAYVLYGGRGVLIVFVKALVIAAAGALLIGLCRPGRSVWPWAALTGVAFLAAAPRLILGPNIGSVLLLAATLFILFRVPSKPGSWRIPIAIGVTFWLWANIDSWFFLGPLTLGLLLAGEWVQKNYLSRPESEDADAEPLGRLPEIPTLARALAVGVVACMLSPHHVRVWELPFELVGSSAIKIDRTMNMGLNLAPTDRDYYDIARLGYNLNGLAYGVLLIGGGALIGFGVGRLRVSHLALWIVFALLSLLSVFAIPFFAVVAVPMLASQLNAISGRVTLGKTSEKRTRMLLTGSMVGRLACLAGLLAACVCAWPGWMHPPNVDGVSPRRVAWAVEPDPGLVKAATQFRTWRESGALPPDARGFIASIALADYCAWYAPQEKVFINSRFNYHRPELPDFVKVRGDLWIIDREEPPNQREAAEVLRKHKAAYLAVYNSQRQIGVRPTLRRYGVFDPTMWDILGWDDWVTWYQDGRTLVFGWRSAASGVAMDRLRLDPLVLAFGPNVERLPSAKLDPAPGPRTWADDFVRPVRSSAPDADEALGWMEYKSALLQRQAFVREAFLQPLFFSGPTTPQRDTFHHFAVRLAAVAGHVPNHPGDVGTAAIPVLAIRAARRAIAANPDHPDGYFALAWAMGDPDLPLSAGERVIGQITALRQCLDRLPPPDRYRVGHFAASPTQVTQTLARLYIGQRLQDGQMSGVPLDVRPYPDVLRPLVAMRRDRQGRTGFGPFVPLDLALDAMRQAVDYSRIEFAGAREDLRKPMLERVERDYKELDRMARGQFDAYAQFRQQATSLRAQYGLALNMNLIGEAVRILQDALQGKSGERPTPDMAVELAALQLCIGRLDDMPEVLGAIRKELGAMQATDPLLPALRAALPVLEYDQAFFSGDYGRAGSLLESMEGTAARDPQFPRPRDVQGTIVPVATPAVGFVGPSELVLQVLPGPLPSNLFNYFATQNAIFNQMERIASYHFLRGYLAILEGNIPAARESLQRTVIEPPPGWGLPRIANSTAVGYLQLIALAEQRAAGR